MGANFSYYVTTENGDNLKKELAEHHRYRPHDARNERLRAARGRVPGVSGGPRRAGNLARERGDCRKGLGAGRRQLRSQAGAGREARRDGRARAGGGRRKRGGWVVAAQQCGDEAGNRAVAGAGRARVKFHTRCS